MCVHQSEWRRMTVEERVDSLRLQLLVQEALVSAMIQGLRGIGIDLVMRREPDQSDA